jgi:hypothetical protein
LGLGPKHKSEIFQGSHALCGLQTNCIMSVLEDIVSSLCFC